MERESRLRALSLEDFVNNAGNGKGTNKPSSIGGEELPAEGQAHADGRYIGLPPAIESVRFACPECGLVLQTPEALGTHLTRHESFEDPTIMNDPRQCNKCKRWIEFSDGSYNSHVKLCMGEKPLC